MELQITACSPADLPEAVAVWNQVVEAGLAFPQTELLTTETGAEFFGQQSFTGVARDSSGELVGLYILHPNNVGRCGHICNASYAVRADRRGQHIGEALVRHCMAKGKELGFRILQFNAVVRSNVPALRLYERLGFVQLGVIPGGFRRKDGVYEDIIPHYHTL
ncbi:MAG TPA: GNAT family N-acetyltransferase [Candidatus Flavonifractor intestinipullorum]|uniref:GNAT family N-acetyltransferase n=1 Tax=Candidatus Flavonifractor intestinipullorum TaxID=2838587 RepID=A0A9D2MA77_9FIRM|nr:GNAT family N-acetyltransferase [Candidatus Flavonifractor intestinipullorum]